MHEDEVILTAPINSHPNVMVRSLTQLSWAKKAVSISDDLRYLQHSPLQIFFAALPYKRPQKGQPASSLKSVGCLFLSRLSFSRHPILPSDKRQRLPQPWPSYLFLFRVCRNCDLDGQVNAVLCKSQMSTLTMHLSLLGVKLTFQLSVLVCKSQMSTLTMHLSLLGVKLTFQLSVLVLSSLLSRSLVGVQSLPTLLSVLGLSSTYTSSVGGNPVNPSLPMQLNSLLTPSDLPFSLCLVRKSSLGALSPSYLAIPPHLTHFEWNGEGLCAKTSSLRLTLSSMLSVSSNSTITPLHSSESLDTQVCDLIAPIPSLNFYFLMTGTLAVESPFSSDRISSFLNFPFLSCCLILTPNKWGPTFLCKTFLSLFVRAILRL